MSLEKGAQIFDELDQKGIAAGLCHRDVEIGIELVSLSGLAVPPGAPDRRQSSNIFVRASLGCQSC